MPQEWQKILDDNGITRQEQEENRDKVLAVVQFFQDRGGGEDMLAEVETDDDVWNKMRHAGPTHHSPSPPHSTSPQPPSAEMSRENSNDGGSGYIYSNPVGYWP